MAVTIWHNPKCATSRKVLDMIRAAGIAPDVVDYVKSPPSAAAIKHRPQGDGHEAARTLAPQGHAL